MTSPQQPTEPTYADRVFRSPAGMAGGVVLLALIAWLAGDAVVRGEGRTPWVALAVALLAVPLIIAFTLRPAVFANDERMRVRNPFRTIALPWSAVTDIRAGYSSEVLTEDAKYQLWAIPVSLRARKKAVRRPLRTANGPFARGGHAATPAGPEVQGHEPRKPTADQAIEQLRELAERNADRPGAKGEPLVRWAYEIAAPAAAGAVLLVILLATG
ncbi:PH domain-containing protein [Streptomyces sp. SLBN-118]|uniref:PH domain-containing protein n=1 Tax=Streptomyces sp. SLBN-118 TaxID=2768454 RepID=UPI0011533414|nr:PH domain-containing protein [Streptomyces sp. SLBN-118]